MLSIQVLYMNSSKLIFIAIALVIATALVTSTVVSFESAHARKNGPPKNNNFTMMVISYFFFN